METGGTSSKAQDEQLVIVLHLGEGVGLNPAESILIQASLSGNKLETEPIKPGHSTLFDCNLIWETDRKSIKRMKMENLPVKIDCYALRNFKGNVEEASREHVGYILVPVKTIPIVSLSKGLQMKPRWSKLIGLSKDWRPHKPEMLMNIMITTSDFLARERSQILDSHCIENSDSIVIEENPIPCMLTSQRGIFIRLLQGEGLLQVGSIDTNCDVFTMKIVMKGIRYLENLKTEEPNPEYYINYVLLGNQHTRAMDKRFNRIHQIHEKVSINFRSSLAALQEYLEKIFFLPFEVLTGDKVIGTAEIKPFQLIKTTCLKEFLEKNPSSVCEMDAICNINIAQENLQPNANRPHLEYKMSIKYVATKKLHQTECLENYKRHQEIDAQAGGDCEVVQPIVTSPARPKLSTLSDIPEVRSESESSNLKTVGTAKLREPKVALSPKVSVTQSEKADIESLLKSSNTGPASELPRIFSYNLQLSSIKLNRKPEKGVWQLSFHHDKADTPRTIINKQISIADIAEDNTIAFNDLELKLYFTSQASHIMELINSSDLCTLCVKGPRGTHAMAHLDCQSLFIGNKEKISGIIMLQDLTDNVTSMAKIFVYLDDLGVNFNAQLKPTTSQVLLEGHEAKRSQMNVTRNLDEQKMMMLDESLTYKMIEELEQWKLCQQETFITDLKKSETQYIERLKQDWNDKEAKYEQDLVTRADKLTSLTKSLQDAQINMKNKDSRQSRDERTLESLKQELEKSYNNQLLSIREKARRMEDDLIHEMKLKDIRFDDMERCIQHLKADNCELLQCKECLQAELTELKRNLIPKDEVEKLLQEMRCLKENLEATQQSKLFYKSQWAKAFRECHKVRRENISTTKIDFFAAKCDRLYDVLDDKNFELNIEKQELDEIKHCLNLSDSDI